MIPILKIRDEQGKVFNVPGITGRGVTRTYINENKELIIVYTDGKEDNIGVVVDENKIVENVLANFVDVSEVAV